MEGRASHEALCCVTLCDVCIIPKREPDRKISVKKIIQNRSCPPDNSFAPSLSLTYLFIRACPTFVGDRVAEGITFSYPAILDASHNLEGLKRTARYRACAVQRTIRASMTQMITH